MPDRSPAIENPWQHLRQLTPARIALGRAGVSLPTDAQLDFQFAHAQARDAVHLPLDCEALAGELEKHDLSHLHLRSAASDRQIYLQRPDLGRRLDEASAATLDEHTGEGCDLALVIADGLSALAVQRHAAPMALKIAEHCQAEGWSLGPITLVEQGRVAIADEIGQRLKTHMVVILLGERPGLSSPDSLGLYFTWAPQVGRHDAQRNCISNIRPEGLSYNLAAHRLLYLMREASRRQLSGVQLKDEAEVPTLEGEPRAGNFLLG
ncbi:ethanolamine ammonia-lyase subunit EutC [Pseudomonas stutzeri]|uniref:Ethanolamine ammonia-lyase small subunit n=1 Tax=Stutzerimonas stutzeri TaxID=316 RepID=A0A2N8S4K9_STUST|nr:ethanolamine ammonia-lyase subunit EutC [Stutzerimonas stutzeri]MCQ4294039.1 ethanolamine ammonia-lyase subunit EutC [Stutzerimonas stutzeri]PNF81564.1 ethanolamine ammonia-lyase [Stutzerimonas stutzeri]